MKPMSIHSKRPAAQEGVMLIEALLGILIFSIGILAMLGMQAVGMRATIDAKYRSEAAFLANRMVGLLWSDPANMTNYATANCGSTVGSDCYIWLTELQAKLPNATGGNAPTIVINGRQATITVFWQRPGETSPSQHVVVAQIYRKSD